MSLTCSMQVAVEFRACGNQNNGLRHQNLKVRGQLCLLGSKLSSVSLKQYSWSIVIPNRFLKRPYCLPCQCSLSSGPSLEATFVKSGTSNLAWSCKNWQGSPVIVKLALAVGVGIFIIWGLWLVVRPSKSTYQNKSDSSWKKGSTYHVATSYIKTLFLWAGAVFICRTLGSVLPPTEAGKTAKQLLNFVGSMSKALAFNHFATRMNSQVQKFMETNDIVGIRNMVIQFVVGFPYYGLRVGVTLSVLECLGFSIIKWDLGDVLTVVFLTLAGDEISQLTEANASRLTSKDDVAVIRNPSTAAEYAKLASLSSLDDISKQLEDIRRQTSANVVSEAEKKSLLSSIDELRERISSVLDIDHP